MGKITQCDTGITHFNLTQIRVCQLIHYRTGSAPLGRLPEEIFGIKMRTSERKKQRAFFQGSGIGAYRHKLCITTMQLTFNHGADI